MWGEKKQKWERKQTPGSWQFWCLGWSWQCPSWSGHSQDRACLEFQLWNTLGRARVNWEMEGQGFQGTRACSFGRGAERLHLNPSFPLLWVCSVKCCSVLSMGTDSILAVCLEISQCPTPTCQNISLCLSSNRKGFLGLLDKWLYY